MISENGNGHTNVEHMVQSGAGRDEDAAARLVERDLELERRRALVRKNLAPAGTLGLPKKLDAARLEHGIPNSAFDIQAVYDRVLVRQVAMHEGETFKDSKIVMAETTRDRELRKAPVGIIVSAGLKALDILHSHGMGLGDKIVFTHSAPFFVRFDNIGGQDQHLVVLKAGQITASFDLSKALKTRELRVVQNPQQNELPEHVLVDETGKVTLPQTAEE